MIEQIKSAIAAVRGFLLWIVTPLAFVLGYIYYLLQKQRGLEDKIGELTRSERQKEWEERIKANEKASEASTRTYTELRDEYLAEHGKGGGMSGSDQGSGPGAGG